MVSPEVVNIVATGRVDAEIDLNAFCNDLDLETAYVTGPGLYLKFEEEGPTVVIARSGKYIVTGASSNTALEETRSQTLSLLTQYGIIKEPNDLGFEVVNVVCTADLGQPLNLDALTIGIGLEHTEYEPEQFPGLIYRPNELSCVILAFASGKLVITGLGSEEPAQEAVDHFWEIVNRFEL